MPSFHCCSINALAVLLSATLLVISAAVVVSVTTVFTASAADDYAHQLTRAVVDGGRSRTSDYLGIARNVIHSTEFGFRSGSYPNFLNNQSRGLPQETFMFSWSSMIYATNFRLTAIGAGFNDGTWTHCNVINSETEKFYCEFTDPMLPTWKPLPNGTNAWQFTEIYHDYENGSRSTTGALPLSPTWQPRITHTLYNPRIRPWYAPHITAGPYGPTRFTSVYLNFFQDYPIVGISAPIPNTTDHTLMGVSAVAVDLRDFSIFLSELPATAGTATAIVDNEGILLGLSNKESPLFDIFTPPPSASAALLSPAFITTMYNANNAYANCAMNGGTGNIVCRRGPATCSMPTIRLLYALRPDFFGGGGSPFPSLTARVELVTMKGNTFYVGTSAVANYTNLLWRLVTVIPEEDLTGEITKGRNLAIILAAVVAVVASVVSAVALWLLLKPLRAIAERMYEASTLRDGAGAGGKEGDGAVGSRMAEIRTIEDAFNTLFGQLMKARSFLPASLLAQLDAQGETDDDDDDEGTARDGAESLGNGTYSTSQHNNTSHSGAVVLTGADGGTTSGETSHSHSRRDSSNAHIIHSDASTTKSSRSAATIFGLGMAGGASVSPNQISSVVRSKHVTVLCFNLVGFHAQVRADAAGALGRGYAALVEAASEASRARRGVLDSFHGDRFVVTFNAAIGCGSHATAALHVAGALAAAAGGRRTTAGVASGIAHVGNTGSAKARRFATVGPVYAQAAVLERLAKAVPAPLALMTRAVADDTQHAARSVFLELVRLPGAGAATTSPTPLASLVAMQAHANNNKDAGSSLTAADEWMYELAAAETCSESSALAQLNRVFLDLLTNVLHVQAHHHGGHTTLHPNRQQTKTHHNQENSITIESSDPHDAFSTDIAALSSQLTACKSVFRGQCRAHGEREDVLWALATCDRLLHHILLHKKNLQQQMVVLPPQTFVAAVKSNSSSISSSSNLNPPPHPLPPSADAACGSLPSTAADETMRKGATIDLGIFYKDCVC